MRKEWIYGKLICSALFLLGTCLPASAQTGHLSGVRVVNDEIKKNGREVHVNFVLDIEEMHVKRQESVRLYPVVVAKEGGKSLELPSVVLDGRVRDKVHRREKALTGSAKTDGAYIALRRKNGEAQQVEYAVTLPYEPWMAQSRLVLREQVTGCLECAQSGMEETPVKNTFLQLFRPQYATAFVQPRKETVKVRNEVRVARLQFRQDSYNIAPKFKNNESELATVSSSVEVVKTNPDLTITGIYITGYASPEGTVEYNLKLSKNNESELATVSSSVEVVKTNPDLTITGIYITGYASPEGTVEYNLKLSKNRAEALAAYAQKDTEVDASLWHVTGVGEDWEGLRKEVEKHPLLLKIDDVLRIIDECDGDKDLCEQRIRDLVPPEIYQRLLNEMYGPLRRNEYRIEYNVRNFNLEEAKNLLKTRPDLLSVEEIYMVADSYGKGSAEYDEAMLTAARTYPANAAAVVNGACVKMEQGDVKGAIDLLEGCEVKDDASVLNALGVACARDKQYDKAKEILERALKAGSMEAQKNLEQLAGVVADL